MHTIAMHDEKTSGTSVNETWRRLIFGEEHSKADVRYFFCYLRQRNFETIVRASFLMLLILSLPLYSVAQKSTLDARALYGGPSASPAIGVVTLTTSVDEKGVMSKIRVRKEGKVSRKNIRAFKKLFRQHVDRVLLERQGAINEIAFTFRITAKRKDD